MNHTARDFHRKAMEFNSKAIAAKKWGDTKSYKELLEKAFNYEKDAAMVLYSESNCEPTRSILFRSAGWMAYNLGNYTQADVMVARGLIYVKHDDIKEELMDLLREVRKSREKTKVENEFENKKITDI